MLRVSRSFKQRKNHIQVIVKGNIAENMQVKREIRKAIKRIERLTDKKVSCEVLMMNLD